MVLEDIPTLQGAHKHPVSLFFIAFIVTSACMIVAFQTFPDNTSVLTLAFVAVAFMPIMHALFIQEEQKEVDEDDMPFAFIATHFEVIHIYGWIFVGLIATYAFWYAVLPATSEGCSGISCVLPSKDTLFREQNKVYTGITGKAAGQLTANAVGSTECFDEKTKSFEGCFQLIFNNNMWVMVLAIIFSFVWGAGALFLLGWNASVIGLFIGSEILSKSLEAGVIRAIGYLPHGLPEIMAYFVASIAGGMISATISKRKFAHHELRIVAIDSVLLLLLATITLVIGAFIETATIFNYWEAALGGIVAFMALYTVLYVPSVRYRVNRLRES